MFFAFGFVLLPTMALTSPMLDELLHYPADTTGYMAIPRSVALVGALILTGCVPARTDTRLLVLGGMVLVIYANWQMLGYSSAMDWRPLVVAGVLQGAGLGILLPALTKAACSTLAPVFRQGRHLLRQHPDHAHSAGQGPHTLPRRRSCHGFGRWAGASPHPTT